MPDLPTASTRAAETVGLPTFHGIYALTSSFWHTNTGRAHGQWKLAGTGSSTPLCFGASVGAGGCHGNGAGSARGATRGRPTDRDARRRRHFFRTLDPVRP